MSLVTPKKGYKSVPWLFGKEIEIPEEWGSSKLKEVVILSQGLQVPEENQSSKKLDGYERFLRIVDYQEEIPPRYVEISKRQAITNEKTIVMVRYGAGAGNIYTGLKGVIANNLFQIISKKDNLKNNFLYIFLKRDFIENYLRHISGTTTMPNINHGLVYNLIILLPSLPEQQKIATILSNVDNLIEATEQVITHSKKVKTGLMQKLLTRGIGHVTFKKVPWLFGKEIEIPEEWEIKKLETLVDILDSKRIPLEVSERKKRTGKYPYYGASGIIDYVNDFIFDERILCLSEDGENLKSRVLPIAFTVEQKCWVNNHAHVLKMKENVSHYFIEKVLNHISLLKYVASTAIPKLNQRDMCVIPIICPPLPEQQKIASILSNIDVKITSQEQYKDKLEKLKKSLMQKLLTGEVRV